VAIKVYCSCAFNKFVLCLLIGAHEVDYVLKWHWSSEASGIERLLLLRALNRLKYHIVYVQKKSAVWFFCGEHDVCPLLQLISGFRFV
jgi:hypothetical protein